ATGKLQKTLGGHVNTFRWSNPPFTWSSDQKTIAMCGALWRPPEAKLRKPKRDQDNEPKVEFSVFLWDVPTGMVRNRVGRFKEDVYVSMTPDGKTVAVFDRDQISFWDTATGRQTRTLPSPHGFPLFAPDGRTFANGNQFFLNGLDQPPVVLPFSVYPLAFSPD